MPTFKSPDAQYHYAQFDALESEREAAWLAVPGRFPNLRGWTSMAYTQLARTLFRHRDFERLGVLAAELARSEKWRHESLARVARAGAAALRDDPDQVIDQLENVKFNVDPELTELSLEITFYALAHSSGPGTHTSRLTKLENDMVEALHLKPFLNERIKQSILEHYRRGSVQNPSVDDSGDAVSALEPGLVRSVIDTRSLTHGGKSRIPLIVLETVVPPAKYRSGSMHEWQS
jgi:hypothetical protein